MEQNSMGFIGLLEIPNPVGLLGATCWSLGALIFHFRMTLGFLSLGMVEMVL